MYFNYNYPDTYDDSKTIIVLYIPGNSSTVSIDLFIDSVGRYPMNLTLQRGNAWRNETWEMTGSSSMVWDNVTLSWEFWQAPVVWSSNVTETGIYHTSQLESGWYTLSMFGPVKATKYVGSQLLRLVHLSHIIIFTKVPRIDSYRVLITVTVPNESLSGFFLASSDWYR